SIKLVFCHITFALFQIRTRDGYELLTGWFHTYVHHTVVPRDHKTVHIDALDGEYEDEYSCFPPPVGMIIISIIEVATFLYDYLNTGDSHSVNGPSASVLIYDPHRRKEAWRFLCYMLVHVGWLHLILNLIIQVALGIPLEMVHGWWRIFIVYSAGVILGSLGTSVADPNVFLAGASGGVYALITAHLATLIMNWSEMQFAWVQLIIFVIVCGTDIGSNVYNFVHSVDTNIGHAAHLGGAVAGLLVGLFVLRNLEVRSWEKKICLVAVVIYSILMIGAIVLHISAPGYFPYQSV
ncbi:hypothetical protein AAG570_013238, partial [Ranatra chinensis]